MNVVEFLLIKIWNLKLQLTASSRKQEKKNHCLKKHKKTCIKADLAIKSDDAIPCWQQKAMDLI